MPLIQLVQVLIVVGVLLWLVNWFIPMAGSVKSILNPALLLLLLTAGCASVAPVPKAAQPPVVATQAAPTQPVATPAAPTTTTPPAPKAGTPVTPVRPPAAPRVAVVAAPNAPAVPLTLDLKALEAQLKATKAIGLFTKMSLKNKVDDLMQQFREHYQGKTKRTMTDLRRSYDLLIMKVLALLQDGDQPLASAIVSSREAIWALLSDQNKFANL
jgi:hypothetical protein